MPFTNRPPTLTQIHVAQKLPNLTSVIELSSSGRMRGYEVDLVLQLAEKAEMS